MDRRLLVGLNLLVAVALLLVGCQKRPTAEEIVLKMQEVEASTEDMHGVIEFSVQEGDKAESAVIEMWEKKPDKVSLHCKNKSQRTFMKKNWTRS